MSTGGDFLGLTPIRPYRFNHSGQDTLYLASEEETAVVETLQEHKGKPLHLWLAEVSVRKHLRVLDFTDGASHPRLLRTLIWSAMLRTPRSKPGHFQPQYLLTRFLADIVRMKAIDGVLYGSSQYYPFAPDIHGTNLAILRPDYHDFVSVEKYRKRAWKLVGDWKRLEQQRMVLQP